MNLGGGSSALLSHGCDEHPTRYTTGHFGNESFQSSTCIGTDKLIQNNQEKTCNKTKVTYHKQTSHSENTSKNKARTKHIYSPVRPAHTTVQCTEMTVQRGTRTQYAAAMTDFPFVLQVVTTEMMLSTGEQWSEVIATTTGM